MFRGEEGDDKIEGDDSDDDDLCTHELREALSRSNSQLEARESWETLEALAMADEDAAAPASAAASASASAPARSSQVDPQAVAMLVNMAKQKMKQQILFCK